MGAQSDQHMTGAARFVISVDAMGGDEGPATVVAGMAKSARKNPRIGFILHGPRARSRRWWPNAASLPTGSRFAMHRKSCR